MRLFLTLCEIQQCIIFQMLNCILGMVDKTKRALTILQQRNGLSCSPPPGQTSSSLTDPHVNPMASSSSQLSSPPAAAGTADPFHQQLRTKQSMNEILAATIRSTEERVVEVRRRAEEAVQEVCSLKRKLRDVGREMGFVSC